MKYLTTIILTCLLASVAMAQAIAPKRFTSNVDVVLIGGQSNGENFFKSSIYGNSPNKNFGQMLADSLEVSEAWTEGQQMLFAQAGKGVAKRSDLTDWNTESVGEVYDTYMTFLGTATTEQGQYNYPNYYSILGKTVRYRLLLWIQGEADAADIPDSEAYYSNCVELFASIRASLREPTLPIVIIKLNGDINRGATSLGNVRTAQDLLAANDPHTWIVDIDDFDANGSDYTSPGNVHYSNTGLQKILDRVLALCRTSIF